MKALENVSSRRKFITLGATSAVAVLGAGGLLHPARAEVLDIDNRRIAKGKQYSLTSVREMVDNGALKQGDTVNTLGYHEAGDDGDNAYVIARTSVPADGGSIIKLSSGLSAIAVFPGAEIRAEQFGVVGFDGKSETVIKDNTLAMTNAHKTGHVIKYGPKTYLFKSIEIPGGGISGAGEKTILESIDTSNKDVIFYSGVNVDVGEPATFENFVLRKSKSTGKNSGTGLLLENRNQSQGIHVHLEKVKIEDFATGLKATDNLSYTIHSSSIIGFSEFGVKSEVANETNDSRISNSVFLTHSKTAISIESLGGNLQVIHNRIVGGSTGVNSIGRHSSPMLQITNNTLENQSVHGISLLSQPGKTKQDKSTFSQVMISQNRINSDETVGAAIIVDPKDFTLGDLSINNNLIRFRGGEQAVAAINVKNSTRFMVNHNTINCDIGKGHRGLFVSEDCSSGILSANHVILPLNGHTLNESTTTTVV